jgi:hypothetical protein
VTAVREPSLKRRCNKKRGYSSRAEAEEHRDRLIAEGDEARSLDVFWCIHHRLYHVGHLGMPGRAL